MANYLKKKNLYTLASALVEAYFDTDVKPDKMIRCEYKFYRGSEWLEGSLSNGYCFKLFVSGYCSFEVLEYDEDHDRFKRVFRDIFYKVEWQNLLNDANEEKNEKVVNRDSVVNDVSVDVPEFDDKFEIAFENSLIGTTNRLIHSTDDLSYCELVSEYTGFKCKSEDVSLSENLRNVYAELAAFFFYFLHPGL